MALMAIEIENRFIFINLTLEYRIPLMLSIFERIKNRIMNSKQKLFTFSNLTMKMRMPEILPV